MTKTEKADFFAKLFINKDEGGAITEWARVGNSIVGSLVGDEREDKYEPIKTSKIVKIHTIDNQLILETLNSYYFLLDKGSEYGFYANLAEYQDIKKRIELVMEEEDE